MIKIKSIEVYKFDLPLKEGRYNWSHQSSVSVFDSTIVKINTNKDTFGFGETCTLGPAYLPAYPEGVREGIKKIWKFFIRHRSNKSLRSKHSNGQKFKRS